MLRQRPQHAETQQRTGGNVDKMVLVGGQHRQRNQPQPGKQRQADFGKPPPIKRADYHRERDVQRRSLVIRRVKRQQRIEQQL